MTPESLLAIKKAKVHLTKISDMLFAKNIPDHADYKTLLSLFEDSEMQKLLGSN